MAAIHDLIAQVNDPRLQGRLSAEWALASQNKKFGLVFEDHLPELMPLYGTNPKRGDLVCRRSGPLKDILRVRSVRNGVATCTANRAKLTAAEHEEIAFSELVVVRQFGDPIFPSLTPVDQVQNGPPNSPWHTLIEADNYHALQLLDYLYAGQVDCIYIDPPYNTGARDWKYNNDYVDGNDGWRHSKWLAFMERRLRLAKRLLKPDTGVLIVTIDEHELYHLGMLLEQEFPEAYRQLVTIVINPKGNNQGRFARVEEYALFTFMPEASVFPLADDLLSTVTTGRKSVRWANLLRSGSNAQREDRPGLFYPVFIDTKTGAVVDAGDSLPLNTPPNFSLKRKNLRAVWPVRSDGTLGNWSVGAPALRILIEKGYTSLGGHDPSRNTYSISYLNKKPQLQIESGEIVVVSRDEVRNTVALEYAEEGLSRTPKTVWYRRLHDAGAYGSDFLTSVIGRGKTFSYPKSLYATRDALASVLRDRPTALVLDFFAGSGTTLNAVNLLNAADGGQRRCILVTNNEVSADEAETLRAKGYQPGEAEWEANGICKLVTWPRAKFTIRGKRDDGSALSGEYFTGKVTAKSNPRNFTHIGFVDTASLNRAAKKKQLLSLIGGLPQGLVGEDCKFIVSENHPVSVIFDTSASDEWLEELDAQGHITDFFIVTPDAKTFNKLRQQVDDVLGPMITEDLEKRPLSEGFASNLVYFKLDFLDKDRVALSRAFREILPLLWLKAGGVGPRPELPAAVAYPAVFAPEHANFAVLLDEGSSTKLIKRLRARNDLSYVFIVTDADESFKAISADVQVSLGESNGALKVVQLYRDYLINFMINKRLDSAAVVASGEQE